MTTELVTVFAMRGAVTYRGFSFSITLRADGEHLGQMSDAIFMMDSLIEAHDNQLIDLSAFAVQDPNDQRPPQEAAQRPMSQQGQAPQQNYNQAGAGGVDTIIEAKKMVNPESGDWYVGLFVKFGQKASEFPVYRVAPSNDNSHFNDLCEITKCDWAMAQIGYKIGTTFAAEYVNSEKTNKNGKPYHNLRRLFVPSSASNNVPF